MSNNNYPLVIDTENTFIGKRHVGRPMRRHILEQANLQLREDNEDPTVPYLLD